MILFIVTQHNYAIMYINTFLQYVCTNDVLINAQAMQIEVTAICQYFSVAGPHKQPISVVNAFHAKRSRSSNTTNNEKFPAKYKHSSIAAQWTQDAVVRAWKHQRSVFNERRAWFGITSYCFQFSINFKDCSNTTDRVTYI